MRKLLLLLIAFPAYAQVPISGTLDVDPATLRGPQGVQGPAGPAGRDATISYANGVCSSGGYSWPCSSSTAPAPTPTPTPAPTPPPAPTPVPPPTGGLYDLASALDPARAVMTINLPASPRVTSQATVRTASEFTASIAVAGRRTIVAADISIGGATIRADDTEVVLQGSLVCANDGQTYWFAGNLDRHRLIGAGGQLVCQLGGGPGPGEAGPADVTLYGVDMRSPAARSQYGGENDLWAVNRFAVLHSSLDSYRYALFLMNQPQDVVIANSSLQSGGGMSVHRVGGAQRAVYVDSYFAVVREGGAGFRQHDNGRSIYVARNVFVGAGPRFTPTAGVAQPGVIISGVWFLNNRVYQQPSQPIGVSLQLYDPDFGCTGYPCLQNLTVRDNEMWTNTGRLTYANENQATWTFSGNRVNPPTTVPAWARQPFAPLPADYRVLP